MMKTSLVTGATGQDGAYLTRKLLSEGRRVCAMIRRTSTSNMSRLLGLRGEWFRIKVRNGRFNGLR